MPSSPSAAPRREDRTAVEAATAVAEAEEDVSEGSGPVGSECAGLRGAALRFGLLLRAKERRAKWRDERKGQRGRGGAGEACTAASVMINTQQPFPYSLGKCVTCGSSVAGQFLRAAARIRICEAAHQSRKTGCWCCCQSHGLSPCPRLDVQ